MLYPEQLDGLNDFGVSLNASFLYLAPPEDARKIFDNCTPLLRIGGLAVVQFNTEIMRRSPDGKILGGNHAYSLKEGESLLRELYDDAFVNLELETFPMRFVGESLIYSCEVILASGIRTK